MRATSTGIELITGQGLLEAVSDHGFQFRYGCEVPSYSTPIFAGFSLRVADIGMVATAANRLGLASLALNDALVLLPSADLATAIRFEPAVLTGDDT